MPLRQDAPFETPRQLVAESSAPLPVVIFPDGSTEPAPAGSVLAEDIIGQLTNEQIEEIEAAKVSGKLTAEQIASIEAAQVTGQLVDAQIKEIGVGKLKGFIEGSQIAAETITGGNIAALTITGAKIVGGTILGEKIAAATITGANIAAETITGTKIAGETITGAKIAAGTITAGKLSVSELSAITANLGTVTAGTITGNLIRNTSSNPQVGFDSEGLYVKDGAGTKQMKITVNGFLLNEGIGSPNKITWQTSGGSAKIQMVGQEGTEETHNLEILVSGSKSSKILIESAGKGVTQAATQIIAGEFQKRLLDSEGRSDWLQVAGTLIQRKVIAGRVSSAGAKVVGDGFTCSRVSKGLYKVTYTSATTISSCPVVSPITTTFQPDFALRNIGAGSFEVQFWNATATNAEDIEFSFHVYG